MALRGLLPPRTSSMELQVWPLDLPRQDLALFILQESSTLALSKNLPLPTGGAAGTNQSPQALW